ncbi:flagellar filament capping protein FliD [Brevibacillus fortis]|uniref:flagellar filament capping protein FliD n=1 Tax=Brevibacillus fortis TaxID=2126352 RepID=UPI002E1DFA1D|nr:flagellar filament capping protein FliD [Brevibacillus fortis]
MVSPIRFGGMASGLDTEKIVKDLMKAEREPLNKLLRKKQQEEWRRDSYRDMNKLLYDFQKSLDSLRFASNIAKKKAASDNESAVSVVTKSAPSLSNYSIKVNKLAQPAVPPSAQFQVDPSISGSTSVIGSSFEFEIASSGGSGASKITVDANDTIDKVISKINQSGSGVSATYFNNSIVLTSSNGSTFDVKVTNGDGSKLGMGNLNNVTSSNAGTPGVGAEVEINGIKQTISGNTFTYDGMEITVKQVTATPSTISVKTDGDALFDTLKNFVDKYNQLMDAVNGKISEKKNKGYQPLLDEEKESLPEKTAEKMENMAKSGILQRDPILSNVLDSMRMALSSKVNGADPLFDTLSEIGITGAPSGKYAYLEKGKLYINENKLREAIEKDTDKVINLFTQYDKNDSGKTGLAQRLYDKIDIAVKQLSEKAGSTTTATDTSVLSRNIETLNKDIKRWEDRLKDMEDRYWKKFSAMEKSIAKTQSQGTWFANMLGGSQ